MICHEVCIPSDSLMQIAWTCSIVYGRQEECDVQLLHKYDGVFVIADIDVTNTVLSDQVIADIDVTNAVSSEQVIADIDVTNAVSSEQVIADINVTNAVSSEQVIAGIDVTNAVSSEQVIAEIDVMNAVSSEQVISDIDVTNAVSSDHVTCFAPATSQSESELDSRAHRLSTDDGSVHDVWVSALQQKTDTATAVQYQLQEHDVIEHQPHVGSECVVGQLYANSECVVEHASLTCDKHHDEAVSAQHEEAPAAQYEEAPAAEYEEAPAAEYEEAPAAEYEEAHAALCDEAVTALCDEAVTVHHKETTTAPERQFPHETLKRKNAEPNSTLCDSLSNHNAGDAVIRDVESFICGYCEQVFPVRLMSPFIMWNSSAFHNVLLIFIAKKCIICDLFIP